MASMTFIDYGQASSSAFMGDIGDREHILPGGAQLDSAATYAGEGAYTIKLNDAAAAQGDTTITVDALPVALPDNAELRFGSVTVTLNGAKAAGQTSLTVDALGGDIADDTEAVYDTSAGTNIVVAGTLLGRTNVERLAGDGFGPFADADDEIYILAEDVDLDATTDCNLVRHGSMIKYDFLPSWTGSSATAKTKLYASYEIVKG